MSARIHNIAQINPQSTRSHRYRKNITPTYARNQFCLPSRLWILFFMLLSSMLPNSCRGACANAHPQSRPHPNPASYNVNFDLHTIIISFNFLPIFRNQL